MLIYYLGGALYFSVLEFSRTDFSEVVWDLLGKALRVPKREASEDLRGSGFFSVFSVFS